MNQLLKRLQKISDKYDEITKKTKDRLEISAKIIEKQDKLIEKLKKANGKK